MAEELFTHEFDNGLTLVAQRMAQMKSTALAIAAPVGSAHDPEDTVGSAAVATYWLLRGAGQRDTRQLHDALDSLGCQHDEHAQSVHLLLSAAQLGSNLEAVLEIYADILRRPALGDQTFGPCRDLVTQALDGLEDEPMRKCHTMIRERFYPYPLGRNPYGSKESLEAMQAQGLRKHLQRAVTPRGCILAVAGNFQWNALRDTVGRLLGDWKGQDSLAVKTQPAQRGQEHVTKPTAQVQITLAYEAATMQKPNYYAARVAEMILSGGMSARLFTEVREKRGLVYAVAARYHSLRRHAGMFVYAGTTPQRAQETFAVIIQELERMGKDIQQAELARAKTQLKSSLIMQGESTSARSDALAGDWFHLHRLRSLTELSQAIDAVSVQQVQQYVQEYPAKNLTVLTIGPEPLKISV